jgi:hypothetical protein
MKKTVLVIAAVLFFSPALFAGGKDESFKQTIETLKKAIVAGDISYLSKHIAFEGIIRSKVKKYAGLAGKNKSFMARGAGAVASWTEPAITKAASSFTLKEFGRASPSLRRRYLDALHITRSGDNGQSGYISGSFLGRPAFLAAVRNGKDWVIVAAESPIIDEEFNRLLRYLRVPAN